MRDLIRASSLSGFDRVVSELGGDPAALLSASGIEPALASRPDAYLPYSSLADVLDRAASTLRRPDFGLRLSRHQSIDIFGAVALIARHSATAAEALTGLERYLRYYSPAFTIGVARVEAHRSRYTFTLLVSGIPRREQVLELSLGVSLDLFRILLGPDFRPLEVLVPHPARSSRGVYEGFFDCPVSFGADACGFELDPADLDRRRDADHQRLRQLAQDYLRTEKASDDLDTQVRETVRQFLPTGTTTLPAVAEHLNLHPRTLQRRLRAEGSVFETILDDVRRDLAQQYLLHTDHPVGRIASMLGYSEQSALARATGRWFGESPARLRARPHNSSSGTDPQP